MIASRDMAFGHCLCRQARCALAAIFVGTFSAILTVQLMAM